MFYPTSKRSARWSAIKAAMGEWVASRPEPKIWNNSLRAYINVTGRTLREIPYWGSRRKESTTAICEHLNEILRFAVKKEEVQPRSNSSRKFQKLFQTGRLYRPIQNQRGTIVLFFRFDIVGL